VGAAGVAISKMLLEAGVPHVVGADRKGAIWEGRTDLNPAKQWFAENTNPNRKAGALHEILPGADVFIGVSGPGLLTADDLRTMGSKPIVFAMANPDPEIRPEQAAGIAAVIATGRSDFPNQINNVLCFPGIFRGALDAGATTITEGMKLAAANAIASAVSEDELSADFIIPSVFDKRVVTLVAEAAGAAVQEEIKRVDEAASRDRAALERRTAGLDRDERETQSAAQALPTLLKELEEITGNLSAEGFAPGARARLQDIGANIDATDYDEVAHELAREAVQRLAGADAEYTELLRAEEAVQAARAAIDRARQELDEWQATLVQAEQRAKELAELLAAQKDPRADLIRVGGEIGALEASERRLRLALGAAEQRLEDCRRFRRLHELQSLEMAKARSEQQIYDDLATAFGRKGVQALIIDAVIPEIEEEANRLLNRMTNGRMSVALHTQRELQRGGATETLDITIADELGTRAYEMFSGGEAFRINLSLRIALSKLLARRAGAPLPTLIVDEGFGTQDAAGRERLLEAINAVSRDFECLIVITHIDELRDQFDRQIRVEKRPEGSFAWVE